jgi:23S rRNA (adenine2503-C2)-methyltransferase
MKKPQLIDDPQVPLLLTNCLRPELEEWCASRSFPAYRARQVWHWFYQRTTDTFEQMTDLPRRVRDEWDKEIRLRTTHIVDVQHSSDGTEKYVLRLDDGNVIEAVWIPMGSHYTVCISTQVGCPVGCRFCASGVDGLVRNLSAAEIVEQVWHMRASHPGGEGINIVFMGIGEPFYNYDNLIRAMTILHDAEGLNIGWRRMTVSTTGVIAGIRALVSDAPQVNLAVSLHAPTDAQRRKLISQYPADITSLLKELATYYEATRRLITYEYIMLKDINDSRIDAEKLAAIAHAVPSKVNLIPYNTVPNGEFHPSSRERIKEFAGWLEQKGVPVMIRRRKGSDIAGACGQLRQQQYIQ